MNVNDFGKLLEAGTETQRIDFKESCPWEVRKFAKDILAMSNVQDGGLIILGVKEKSDGAYERQGISTTHKATYKRDAMMDQMTAFADPHVNFSVEFLKDGAGIEYGIITVEPFKEIPVICKKDSTETKAGGIYYRNRNRRIESALVSNSYDMRDIIERAAIKLMQRAKEAGYAIPDSSTAIKSIREKLKRERGDL